MILIILYVGEKWSLTFREQSLRVFEKGILRRILNVN